jgi:hypothetical protein
MTQEEAKEYVMTHVPCTMTGIVTLFDTYFHGTVKLEKLVGMNAKLLGYNRLVFYMQFPADIIAEAHPMPQLKFLLKCFRAWCAYHDFKIDKEGFDGEAFGLYVAWVKPAIEIKEDRRGL